MVFIRSRKNNELPDERILSAYKETGNNLYLGILFERYAHLAFGVCLKYLRNEEDSKDAVLHIFENMRSDLRKYQVRSFGPWLHSVAKNHCLMLLRKKQLVINDEKGFRQAEATLLYTDGMNFMNEDITARHLEHLEEAMDSLNEEQRLCIRLFYLEEKSYQEVSTASGFDLNQVKSYIQNGKRNLKNYLLRRTVHDEK